MIVQSTHVWLDETFTPAQLFIEQGKIKQVFPYNHVQTDLDVGDHWILPGFIDIHCHGYSGCNANQATIEGLKKWNDSLGQEGVTLYLITTSTAPWADLQASFPLINEFILSKPVVSEPLGIHIEGPFISKTYKGAQSEADIKPPTPEALSELWSLAPNQIKMVAIAVEEDDDGMMQKACIDKGIVVAIGHSGATLSQVKKAVKEGVRNITHTFNGMNAFHHREPGVIGAAMLLDDTYCEVIADGVHVHFDVVTILGKMKGKDKLIVVTDAVAIKGLPVGEYHFKDRVVRIGEDGCGYLADGRLAGSSNRMNVMVANLIYQANLPLICAINAATKNPAKLLNLQHKGELMVGKDADFIVVTPSIEILSTYRGGQCVYRKEDVMWKSKN